VGDYGFVAHQPKDGNQSNYGQNQYAQQHQKFDAPLSLDEVEPQLKQGQYGQHGQQAQTGQLQVHTTSAQPFAQPSTNAFPTRIALNQRTTKTTLASVRRREGLDEDKRANPPSPHPNPTKRSTKLTQLSTPKTQHAPHLTRHQLHQHDTIHEQSAEADGQAMDGQVPSVDGGWGVSCWFGGGGGGGGQEGVTGQTRKGEGVDPSYEGGVNGQGKKHGDGLKVSQRLQVQSVDLSVAGVVNRKGLHV
jgi:hypothetical protein